MTWKNASVIFLIFAITLAISVNKYVFAEVNSVRYVGTIKERETHTYYFTTTAEGTVTITDNMDLEENQLQYSLVSVNSGEEYFSGDTLPAGDYRFIVSGTTGSVSYDFVIEGLPFSGNPDTSLPSLSVTNPSDYERRLPKGTITTTVTGSTNGVEAQISPEISDPIPISSGQFSKNISLGIGSNHVQFYSKNSSGNEVLTYTNIISPGTYRIAGSNRYDVSANTANELYKRKLASDTIFITRGDIFTDSVSATPYAAQLEAPILLTYTDTLPNPVKTFIQDKQPKKAIVIGGPASVSDNVVNELQSLGVETVERISGNNRYDISKNVAQKMLDNNPEIDSAIVVSGETFTDAVSATTIAGMLDIPVLLTASSSLRTEIKTFLNNNPDVNHFVIVGGPSTISETVKTELEKYGDVDRSYGQNRYDTATGVVDYFRLNPSSYVITRGDTFTDALHGMVLGSLTRSPLLLTKSDNLPDAVRYHLYDHQDTLDNIYILGGTSSVSSSVEQELYNIIP